MVAERLRQFTAAEHHRRYSRRQFTEVERHRRYSHRQFTAAQASTVALLCLEASPVQVT
jgi:hypothetical protein